MLVNFGLGVVSSQSGNNRRYFLKTNTTFLKKQARSLCVYAVVDSALAFEITKQTTVTFEFLSVALLSLPLFT